jgi:hypothetical protein
MVEGRVAAREERQEVVMLGVELGLMRRRWAVNRDWPRMGVWKPVAPEEEEGLVLEEEVGRDLVDWGAVVGKEPGRGVGWEDGLEGKGEGEGGYFEEVRGGEIRWAALLWELVGREAEGMLAWGMACAANGLGIGSVGVRASGGL